MDIPSLYQSVFKPNPHCQELALLYARTGKEDIEAAWLIRFSPAIARWLAYARVYTSAVDTCLWINGFVNQCLSEDGQTLIHVDPDSDYIDTRTMKGLYQLIMDHEDFMQRLAMECRAFIANALPSPDASELLSVDCLFNKK